MNITMPWNTTKQPTSGWTAPIEDVKHQIGKQIDHIAEVAAQVGRDVVHGAASVAQDAGAQTAGVARDVSNQTIKATQDAGTQAAAAARDIPTGASGLAQQALHGVTQLGRDLRSVRVTREPAPAPRSPDIMPGIALLAGVGSGLALMFFFDPERGRRRRTLLRDQLVKWTRIGRESATGKAKDVRNRTVGVMYEARKAVSSKTGDQSNESDTAASESHSYSTASNGNSQDGGYETAESATERPIEQPIS